MTLKLFKSKINYKNPRYGGQGDKLKLICKYLDEYKKYFIIIPVEYFDVHYGKMKNVISTYSSMVQDWEEELTELKPYDGN